MARLVVAFVLTVAPCPVLRVPSSPAPAVVTVRGGYETPRVAARSVQVQFDAVAPHPRLVHKTVKHSLRAVRATLSHQKPVRRARTAPDFPHTHSGLVRWLRTLPDRNLAAIAVCESVRDDSWPQSARSWARGVWQVIPSTARSLGIVGDPAALSWREQYAAARRLEARDGLRAWDCWRFGLVS